MAASRQVGANGDDEKIATVSSDDSHEMRQVGPTRPTLQQSAAPGIETGNAKTSTEEAPGAPRISASTSTSPLSFGQSLSTGGGDGAALVDPTPDEPRPILTGTPLIILIAGILTSLLIVAIDQVVIATALPVLASEFNALAQLAWVVSGFFLTQATGTLTFGQLYTFLPAKYTFLASILLFEIGSILSAVANTFWLLVLGRAVSGFGAGGLTVGMHTIVSQVFRLQDRSILYSSLGALFTAASIAGPLVGGALTTKVSWRWCFWINLPFGAVGGIAVYFALPVYQVHLPPALKGKTLLGRWASIDWIGNILALGMTTALMLPLQWGGSEFAWNSTQVIALFVLSGVLVGLFVWWELYAARSGREMVPLRLLKNRSVVGAATSGATVHVIFGVILTYLPVLYQTRGASALQSGIDILPFMISSVICVTFAGYLVKRIGYYKFWLVLGPWVCAIGSGFLTNGDLLKPNYLIGWQIIIGCGFGMTFQNTMMAIQAEFAKNGHLIPQASSIVGFCQRLGPMIGVSVAGAIFANSLDGQLGTLPFPLTEEQVTGLRRSVLYIWTESTAFSDEQKTMIVALFVEACRRAFILITPAAIISGACALLVRNWNIKKRGRP